MNLSFPRSQQKSIEMNIARKLKFMVPWSVFVFYSLLQLFQGSHCETTGPGQNQSKRSRFDAVLQKRNLLAVEDHSASIVQQASLTYNSTYSEGVCSRDCLNGGFCSRDDKCDCRERQANGSRCQTVPNLGVDIAGTCKSWGQYHFETFDGLYFYFPGKCSYVLAKDCRTTEPQYMVEVHNNEECTSSPYSCSRSLSLFFSNEEEITILGHSVTKGRIRLPLPQTIGHAFFERLADYILVKTTFGFSLAWDGLSGVYIKLTEEHKGKPCGLCGNYNGDMSDDLNASYNMVTEDVAVFGNSWMSQSPFDSPCESVPFDFPSPCRHKEAEINDIIAKCEVLVGFPFFTCRENVQPNSYVASCINDLCKVDDTETQCRALKEYARACAHAGNPITDWSDDFPACINQCEDSFVHRDCISCCPPTCTFEKECLGSSLHCLDGCYCPDGLVMENGTCISMSDCPCVYHGTAYPIGSHLQEGCNMCICRGGVWNCTNSDCPAECSVTGDMHFTTFDGRIFTFLGTCQYIFAKSHRNNKFTVTLQNAPCGQNLDHSCIQSVTLVTEGDTSNQVTLSRTGEIHLGIHQAISLPYNNGIIEIARLSSLFVQVKTTFGLSMKFDNEGGRLYLQVDSRWKGNTMGLCGTYNGNLRDDFHSPVGMIEGTPQLHANAWKISSACITPVNIPLVDPCDTNQQNALYSSTMCDLLNQDLFALCHTFVNPSVYYQQCRYDACKCGSLCMCTALAHYAYLCAKHKIFIDFRSDVSDCGVVCPANMLYHVCSSSCGRTCESLSLYENCSDNCAEGCNCPNGTFYDEIVHLCVTKAQCSCQFMGGIFQAGEVTFSNSGPCVCRNGKVDCVSREPEPEPGDCPHNKRYFDCRDPQPGLPWTGAACEVTCENLMMNVTCSPMTPCISGCVCSPGLIKHGRDCFLPESCPCSWKGQEYLPGEVVSTLCYTCICQRGVFNCTYHPCPAVCTIYSDRHYRSFDGLEYDYVSDCQVYLVKSISNLNVLITAQNVDCYDSGIICMKSLVISVGSTNLYFNDNSGKPSLSGVRRESNDFQLWKAGYYSVVHYPQQEITVFWDKKTTIHIQLGPQWQGKVMGLCGNFDKNTANDMTTSNNMEVSNAQAFGDSWALGQCVSRNGITRPCEADLIRQPFAKRECAILYSEVFAPCHNAVDVTWFYKNCLTDTCNCNRGGDCECFCTSVTAYAHKCCQKGVAIHWRSPSVCPFDCEYYNQDLGEGPYMFINYMWNDTVIASNRINGSILPLQIDNAGENNLMNFMITPGLYKAKQSGLPVVSLESAERPNYFIHIGESDNLRLEQWEDNQHFHEAASFIHHQSNWIPGYSTFELYSRKGYFISLTTSAVKVVQYEYSESFRLSSSFRVEESSLVIPYRTMCEFRYEACTRPCIQTCSDPHAIACKFLSPVEGCMAHCPKNMLFDEVTLRCVYPEDCINVTTTDLPYLTSTTSPATEATYRSSTTPMTSAVTQLTMTIPGPTTALSTMTTVTSKPPVTSSTPVQTTSFTSAEPAIKSTETTLTSVGRTSTTNVTTEVPGPPGTSIHTTEKMPPSSSMGYSTTSASNASEVIIYPTHGADITVQPEVIKPQYSTTTESTATATSQQVTVAEAVITTEGVSSQSAAPATTTSRISTLTPEVSATLVTTPTPSISASSMSVEEKATSELTTASQTSPLTRTTPLSATSPQPETAITFGISDSQTVAPSVTPALCTCPFNVTQPSCGFLGMPVQINNDRCCPQWECPCRCSMFSDLHVITFDGNDVGVYDAAAYVLTLLPHETIVAHIEQCSTRESANSIRRPVPGGNSGLCFKKLNITSHKHRVLIDRLERLTTVNSRPARLPFTKLGFHIQDTGTMYLIKTPADVTIQWYRSTGIIVLEFGLPSNRTIGTKGLCGCCNGNPADDLKLLNGTIVTEVENIGLFLESWMVETSGLKRDCFRCRKQNCTTGNCTACFDMLNQNPWTLCHQHVTPEIFCELWIRDFHYVTHQCDALALYAAACNKYNVCIPWRTPEFCPLSCPVGMEYQPCVPACESKMCQNKDFYLEHDPTCSFISESCVCPRGTLLHQPDSNYCITEEKCACTDNEGQPRSAGETWNGSHKGCCMYNCLDNGTIISIEPECSEVSSPICEREGEIIIDVIEEGACCPKKICECNLTICESDVPTCENGDKLMIGYSAISCCPEYRCECDPLACPTSSLPACREDQFLVEVRIDDSCCFSFQCVCESCIDPIPTCNEGDVLAVDLNTADRCCPLYHCVCDENLCSPPNKTCAVGMKLMKVQISGLCCPDWQCDCSCENTTMKMCKVGEVLTEDPGLQDICGCTRSICSKADVCVFQGVTALKLGQSLVQHLEGDQCYIASCLQSADQPTESPSMEVSIVNCSAKCEPHQVYVPSTDLYVCCGTCKNISCPFEEEGSIVLHNAGTSWIADCIRYECLETTVGVTMLGSGMVCPPFNETECMQKGGITKLYMDGCCRTCSGLGLLPFTISPVVPTGSTNCDTGKEDERPCRKLDVKMIIRKHDCRTTGTVTVASCDGKCPSAMIFNTNINSYAKFCKCCREVDLTDQTVPLYCAGNATWIDFTFQEPTDCSCRWN
ncbi:otogelin-like protein isoform X1 [Amblyraja radiata]|uniref:otogelin-like protein isoform X1 n=2 Tax=Amblyraja radiata TaxID=386614 RepID=UPI001402FF38|nr:otogelin-like protein isoform X1 [Amblyraja radiata]